MFCIAYRVCLVFSTCCTNLEFGLLAVIAWMCSLKVVRKFLFCLYILVGSHNTVVGKCHFPYRYH
jgi:hypothetical protein